MKQDKKNKSNNWIMMTCMLILAFSLCSCGDKKTEEIEQDKTVSAESQDVWKYLEEYYGIADNPVYGRRIAHMEIKTGTKTTTYDEKIKEDSKGGAVFYKTVTPKGKTDGLVCVYLSDYDNNGICLKADYICNKEEIHQALIPLHYQLQQQKIVAMRL